MENRVIGGLRRSPDDNTTKLIAVLQSWMDAFPSTCTWNVVLTAIEGPIVKHPSTAKKIRQFLAKREVQLKAKPHEQVKAEEVVFIEKEDFNKGNYSASVLQEQYMLG